MGDRPLVATYRIQLGNGMGFHEVTDLLDHLVALGVSHIYTSPVLDAVPGSTHGYDVVDHHLPNDELGGEEGFRHLVTAAQERGLGLVVDIVPNHMATHPHNTRWWDVLRFGRSSAFESWFDIDWEHGTDETPDRLLLAVLAGHYGATVRQGDVAIELRHDSIVVRCADQVFPLTIGSIVEILHEAAKGTGDDTFVAEVDELARCGDTVADHSDALRRLSLSSRFWQGEHRTAVLDVIAACNADPEHLHRVLEQQHYRLAHWSTGTESLDYRRFFDVSGLIGLQMHLESVFDSVHTRTLQWIANGDIDGVRIDHPDGLADPTGYLERLRAVAPESWIVVEKILADGEQLPDEWPVDGTTGYETLILLDRLFVDPEGEAPLTALLAEHAGVDDDFPTIRRASKEDVLHQVLLAEVHRLRHDLTEYDRGLLDRVDMSVYDAGSAISAFLIEFPVYRTYAQGGERADDDDTAIIEGVRAAVHARATFDPAIVDMIADVLVGPLQDELAIRFRSRFQQTTGPVMAKGVEDTAFYRYPRLLSQNEVGGEPATFGISLDDFHSRQAVATIDEPQRMIATSTHDTKRSEDVRARIAVLSEVPDAWATALDVMTVRAAELGGEDRDPVIEYHMHQAIAGAFPLSAERAVGHAQKAAREAKRGTSWLHPSAEHEQQLCDSIRAWLQDDEYLAAVQSLLDVIAAPGRINGLAEKLLAMTIPGVPDLYQGSELWTAEMVDPDNRRPVDFEVRRSMTAVPDRGPSLDMTDIGSAKLRVVCAALATRRAHPAAFARVTGTYQPLRADGAAADHVIGFVRGDAVATVVQRFSARLARNGGWRTTRLSLPEGRWTDAISGEVVDGSVAVSDLFGTNPVALLTRA